jgi:nucleoside-diphosphate-sugar epimerase
VAGLKDVTDEIDFHLVDIADPMVPLEALVEDMDTVFHLASILPPASERNSERTFRVNVEGTKRVLRAAKSGKDKKRLIFTSSVATYQ